MVDVVDELSRMIGARRIELDAERVVHAKRLAEIDKEIAEHEVTLRVARALAVGLSPAPSSTDSTASDESPDEASGVLIKDVILNVLKEAYPHGISAGVIRLNAQAKHKTTINPNTLTVSLGRYKSQGLVRIDGRDWFYIPQSNEAAGDLLEGHPPAASASRSAGPADEPAALRPVEPAPGGGT